MGEGAFERWAAEGRTNVNIGEAEDYVREMRNLLMNSGKIWSGDDVKLAFEKKFKGQEFSLSGMPIVVKGEKPTVALTSGQSYVIEALYGLHTTHLIGEDVKAIVTTTPGNETEEAGAVWISARVPAGKIVVSQGLARKLNVSDDQEIRILRVEQDLNKLDLDQYQR